MKLTYPAIFYPWEEGEGYTVELPDLPGCITEGTDLADAVLMAADAAAGWVLTELEEGREAPEARDMSQIQPEEGGFVSLVAFDIHEYAEKYGKKAVRKNLTIPAWLNTYGEKHHLNYSQILQCALEAIVQEHGGEEQIDEKTTREILKVAGISA